LAGIKDAAVIDVHAHAVLAETMGTAGAHGPELLTNAQGTPSFRVGTYTLEGVRYVGSPFMDPALRIKAMDSAGIDVQLLSPNPLTYFHHIDAASALAFCQTHNDTISAIVRQYPARLGAFAAMPIQDVGAACEELERCVKELGLLGAYMGTDTVRELHHADMDAFYAKCVELDVPLFLHPAPAGIDGPAGDVNLQSFDLDVVMGFAAQEAIAVASLIFGEVTQRHPDLDICLSHGGGSTAYLIGRMAKAGQKRPWAPQWLKADGAFEAAFAHLWFDNHLNCAESLALLTSIVGDNHLVYGTNFVGWDAPDQVSGSRPDIKLADNARRLLRVPE